MAALELLQEARYQAESLGNLVRALELGQKALGSADVEERFHWRRFLTWLGAQLEAHHVPDELPQRLGLSDALAQIVFPEARQPGPVAPPKIGTALGLLWDASRSHEAFLAQFSVEPAPAGLRNPLPPGCGASFAEAVVQAQHAMFRFLCSHGRFTPSSALIEGTRFTIGGPPAATSFAKDGGSIGAAAAVVLYSSWTDTPVPTDVALTGGIDAQGHILPVGALEAKVTAALRERPHLRAVIVPAAGDPVLDDSRIHRVATLAELLEAVFGAQSLEAAPTFALDIEGMVRRGIEIYEKLNAFPEALETFDIVLKAIAERRQKQGAPGLYRLDEFKSLWRAGSCLIHFGDPDGAMERYLQRGKDLGAELWKTGDLDPQTYFGFRGNLAVLLRDVYRYEEAEQLLLDNLRLQRELRQGKRELAKTLGNLGELWTFMDKHDQAEQALSDALAALSDVYPDEVPRELCYLGNLCLRRGEPDRALAFYDKGLAANTTVEMGRVANEAFLRYGVVRALRALGRPEEATREADLALSRLPITNPYPRQLILKHRGLVRLDLGEREPAHADLREAADLTFVRGPLLHFGFSIALAELALDLLEASGAEKVDQARGLLAEFATLAAKVPGIDTSKVSAMKEAASSGAAAERVAETTREVVSLFPY